MENYQIIHDIIFLPKKFYEYGDISMYSLLKDKGYFEIYNQISEKNIQDVLARNPECIKLWQIWSENKRSSSGWFLGKNEDRKYTVGYIPAKEDLKSTEYFDVIEACAAFINREIEQIRKE